MKPNHTNRNCIRESICILLKIFLISILLGPIYTGTATAQTTEPFLRINTEMHSNRINRVDTDNSGKVVITGSLDKTAKIWDAQSGELIRTLHPPIGENQEGQVRSVALSPDGRLAAIGGYTKRGKHDIYLFSVERGKMIHSISDHPTTIQDLEFSVDGRFLAAALHGNRGVRVYQIPDSLNQVKIGTTLGVSLEDNDEVIYNLAFDHNGRLATVSYDGKLRLYDNRFSFIREISTSGGDQPFSIAFSPDGSLIAVGFSDSNVIQVFDGQTLSLLYEPDMKDANRSLNKVVFSEDGRYLYGGGSTTKKMDGTWWRIIRQWENAGRGGFTDIPGGINTILDIKPLSDGRIVFSGFGSDWGIVSDKGNRVVYHAGEPHRMNRVDRSHLKISHDGRQIGFRPMFSPHLMFSVSDRYFEEKESHYPSFTDRQRSVRVRNWQNEFNPTINRHKVNFLKSSERNRSIDINTEGNRIVFGADWYIYCIDPEGNLVWETPTTSTNWAVNISGDGHTIAATHGDGTISWYSMIDGQRLLTLFVHSDNERWILYTPSGYYDASPGAESLLGWHVNQGIDEEGLLYPISRFRSSYNRPDVIDAIFETYDENDALLLANERRGMATTQTANVADLLPPNVEILSPQPGTGFSGSEVNLRYTVKSPEEINAFRVMVDGRTVSTQRGMVMVRDQQEKTVTVQVPAKSTTVSLIAENRHGTSEPASVNLVWKGDSQDEAFTIQPKLYVLAVGVSDYDDPDLKLEYAAKDAKDFADIWQDQQDHIYREVDARILTDGEATRDNILDAMDWITRQATQHDLAMLFFAGHGYNDANGQFYFLPVEAELKSLRRTGIPQYEISSTLASLAGHRLVFMDACHSGNVADGVTRRSAVEINSVINELSSAETGAVTFSSSTGRQFSLEHPEWGNGAFTRALLDGLTGEADFTKSGRITLKMLDLYVSERVKELTGGQQTPVTVYPPNVPDIPIFISNN